MTIPTHTTLTAERRPLRCGERPTEPKSPLFVGALGFAQFGLFVALLGPVMVSMAIKVNTLVPDPTGRTSALGLVLGVGAVAAFLGNAVFGRLSDRTTSRFGRRRPWLVGGVLVMAAALLLISHAGSRPRPGRRLVHRPARRQRLPSPPTSRPSPTRCPKTQTAKVSARSAAIMQNVGILAAH